MRASAGARLLRHPLLHFGALGLLLFVAARGLEPARARQVTISAERISALERGFARRVGHAPRAEERSGLVQRAVEDELWVREALELGLAETDPVVRRRLVQVGRFLHASLEDDAGALRAARDLGLHRTDPIVRRRLIERMRGAVRARARARPVSPHDLRRRFDVDASRYREPERFRITHVFFSRDRHGAAAATVAERELERLASDAVAPLAAVGRGDPFVHGQRLGPRSVAGLEARFGPAFARSLGALPLGRWGGPVVSAYGVHLVFIEARIPSALPALADVEARVREDLLEARARTALEHAALQLRSRYSVRVEEGA